MSAMRVSRVIPVCGLVVVYALRICRIHDVWNDALKSRLIQKGKNLKLEILYCGKDLEQLALFVRNA